MSQSGPWLSPPWQSPPVAGSFAARAVERGPFGDALRDLQALTGGLHMCNECPEAVSLTRAPEPLLAPEERVLGAICGDRLLPPWLPEGVVVGVCRAGHVNFAPCDVWGAERAAFDYHRLREADHLTGSDRTRLRRVTARLRRFNRSQIACHERALSRWREMASRLKTVSFTTLEIGLPLGPGDLEALEGT
jgi:hypothetical protein